MPEISIVCLRSCLSADADHHEVMKTEEKITEIVRSTPVVWQRSFPSSQPSKWHHNFVYYFLFLIHKSELNCFGLGKKSSISY